MYHDPKALGLIVPNGFIMYVVADVEVSQQLSSAVACKDHNLSFRNALSISLCFHHICTECHTARSSFLVRGWPLASPLGPWEPQRCGTGMF